MVARGDLGVEIEFEEIPSVQKFLIKKAIAAGKHCITATQMLESMIKNPRPTRAEITDIANSIYDGTSAIMLSGETAVGKHPIETVKTMVSIAKYTEEDIDYKKRFNNFAYTKAYPIDSDAICMAGVALANSIEAAAILGITMSGATANRLAQFRPDCLVIGLTPSEKVYNQMALTWGVLPLFIPQNENIIELYDICIEKARNKGLIEKNDKVVITSGFPLGLSGETNNIRVIEIN
jgi:pyruvate kinase